MSKISDVIIKFRALWPYYLLQSSFAVITLFIIVLILGKDKAVVISAIGASAFIVFAMPKNVSAKPRNLVGGHFLGLLCGALFYTLALPFYLEYPLAVGLAIFLMVVLDMEHPPAAGTAMAVVIREVSIDTLLTIIFSALLLALVHYLFSHRLKNLV